jgi:hypothetical protein
MYTCGKVSEIALLKDEEQNVLRGDRVFLRAATRADSEVLYAIYGVPQCCFNGLASVVKLGTAMSSAC